MRVVYVIAKYRISALNKSEQANNASMVLACRQPKQKAKRYVRRGNPWKRAKTVTLISGEPLYGIKPERFQRSL
jgi:hypothetical protein